jgi:uncharacterized protein (DUF1778 family)
MPGAIAKTERLEARLTRSQKKRIAEAARRKGTSLSEFVISSVETAAAKVLDEQRSTRLTREAAEDFVRLLMNPPAPNEKLLRAARLHRRWERRHG